MNSNFWTKSVHWSSFSFLIFSQQVPAASINMIPRHFFSRWLTNQDGRLWNCLRKGSIVITDIRYSNARRMHMDPLSEQAMTFTLLTTRHLAAVPIPILAINTAHQVDTAMEAPSPILFWQALISLLQTKKKHFTRQPKNWVFRFKLFGSHLILHWYQDTGSIWYFL